MVFMVTGQSRRRNETPHPSNLDYSLVLWSLCILRVGGRGGGARSCVGALMGGGEETNKGEVEERAGFATKWFELR